MSETPEQYGEQVKEPYTPTPADQALYLVLLTGQMCLKVQQEYTDGKLADLETYNRLYEVARKADVQARKLLELLEGKPK